MQHKEEQELISEAINGNIEAYEHLIVKYEQKIYSLCVHMLNDTDEAYDASQEVCIKIWQQIKYFRGTSKLSTWIYRVTMNQCLDILRKNKRKKEKVLESAEVVEEVDYWNDVSLKVMNEEAYTILIQAINELKEDYKVVVVLRDLEEYSYEQIAEVLRLSLGTVKSRLSRARAKLRKILSEDKEPYRSFFRQYKS